MRKYLILLAASLPFLPGLALADGFQDDWKASSCKESIEQFGTGAAFTVERLRVKVGASNPSGVKVELGSPNDYAATRDANWSTVIHADSAAITPTTMSVIKGAWAVFKMLGPADAAIGIHLDEDGTCRKIEENVARSALPVPVEAHFAEIESQTAEKKIVQPPAATTSTAVTTSAATLPPACDGFVDSSFDTFSVPIRNVDNPKGPFFLTGISDRQSVLDRMDMGQKILWSAMVKSGGWAVYYRMSANGDNVFKVKYLTTVNATCTSYPNAPTDVPTADIPEEAVRYFLGRLGKTAEGPIEEMRSRLGVVAPITPAPATLIPKQAPVAAIAPPPPPPAPEPATAPVPQSIYVPPPKLAGAELARYVKALPKPALRMLAGAQKMCRDLGEVDASIDEKYVTRVDLDGDGNLDYILNDDSVFCLDSHGGYSMISGNAFTAISFIMSTPRGPSDAISIPASYGTVYQYDGFAVVKVGMPENVSYVLLRNGKEQEIRGLPKNGKPVFEISR